MLPAGGSIAQEPRRSLGVGGSNWRLIFAFGGEDAVLVDYRDYHWDEECHAYAQPSAPGEVLREFLPST